MKGVVALCIVLVPACLCASQTEKQRSKRYALRYDETENEFDDDQCGVVNTSPAASSRSRFEGAIGVPVVNIVGGTNAGECKFPWQAFLLIEGMGGFYLCAGALIDDRHILTAAHCLERALTATSVEVRLGEYNLVVSSGNEVIRRSSELFVHPFHNLPRQYENDIGIVRLNEPVQFSRCVAPICLPPSGYQWESGKEICTAIGWGRLYYGGPLSFFTLQEVQLKMWHSDHCLEVFPWMRYFPIVHPKTICAGVEAGGKSACQGDSGGPLMCSIGGRQYFTGIVSTGVGCGIQGLPGVYTEVSQYINWIDTIID